MPKDVIFSQPMPEVVRYVVGFRFSKDFSRVVVIRKNRPVWQKGLLNGIGGKIEPGESPLDAMVREFLEETGMKTAAAEWVQAANVRGGGDPSGYDLYFFGSVGDLFGVQTTTDENILVVSTDSLPVSALAPCAGWVAPLCRYLLSERMNGEEVHVEVTREMNVPGTGGMAPPMQSLESGRRR